MASMLLTGRQIVQHQAKGRSDILEAKIVKTLLQSVGQGEQYTRISK